MLYKRLKFIFLMVCVLSCLSDARGEEVWGLSAYSKCKGETSFSDKCKKDCKATAVTTPYLKFWVAVERNTNGAKFCWIAVGGKRKSDISRPELTFNYINGGSCFWACISGKYGESCNKTEPTDCREDIFTNGELSWKLPSEKSYTADVGTLTDARGTVVEAKIFGPEKASCAESSNAKEYDLKNMNGWKQQEHITVLAIKEIKDNKIVVQPLTLRAGSCRNVTYIKTNAWPAAYFEGSTANYYPDGWVADASGSGKGKLAFAGQCKEKKKCAAGKAFKADGDFTCVDCVGLKAGPNANDVCVTCDSEEIFNNGSCVGAKKYDQFKMLYGNQDSVPSDIDDQCWAKDTTDAYKNCIRATPVQNQ